MTVTIALSAASTDLRDYLETTWKSDFGYNGNGQFYDATPGQPYDQYGAGISGDHGFVLAGSLFYPPSGGGGLLPTSTLNTLTFGDSYNNAGPLSVTSDLVISFSGADQSPNSQFNQAMFALSHGGDLDGGTFPVFPGGPTMHFDGIYDYFATEGTTIIGTNFDDVITAWAGDDIIDGRAGEDTIVGGAGNDTLTGGADNDTFNFDTGSGADTITDLDFGDQIDIYGHWNGATNFGSLTLTNVSGGVEVSAGGSDTILVAGYDTTTLTSGFFS